MKDEIKRMFCNEFLTSNEIAKALGLDELYVRGVIREMLIKGDCPKED